MQFAQHVFGEVGYSNELVLLAAPWEAKYADLVSMPDFLGHDVFSGNLTFALAETLRPTSVSHGFLLCAVLLFLGWHGSFPIGALRATVVPRRDPGPQLAASNI
jgi:hypothetical protein